MIEIARKFLMGLAVAGMLGCPKPHPPIPTPTPNPTPTPVTYKYLDLLFVDLGMPGSGTRYDAELVLETHGLRTRDLAEARQGGPEEALRRLQDDKLDAFFTTTAAPARNLQDLAARHGIRFLSLDARSIERLVARNPGLVPIPLPANTYPAQTEEFRTVAAAALLVTTSEVPDAEVERVTELVFARVDFAALGSAEGARVSKRTALRGVTIPMHPGASRYFAATAASR